MTRSHGASPPPTPNPTPPVLQPMSNSNSEDVREQPVPPENCVWCKQPTGDDAIPLGTGEAIDRNCLGDLREWNQTRFTDILVSSSLESTVRAAYLDEWESVQERVVEVHGDDPELKVLPSRTSNADDYRIHDDSSRSEHDS